MKIYALIVAINNYNKFSGLSGCIHDAEKIESYLLQTEPACKIKKLLNDKAVKAAIVEAFNSITRSIGPEDSFLFYYAGHGTQETADPVWNEPGNCLECIVCYDENHGNPASFLLCDKEFRFLIYELAKTGCHVVTIFDCCHSGGNTRNAAEILPAFKEYGIKERRLGNRFAQRRWQDFIFHNKIKQEETVFNDIYEMLPQGKHVQIAACESDESAMEVNGEGVFTKNLLRVLKNSGGNVSYHDLRSRIRQYLRFVYKQQPRIYVTGSSEIEIKQLLFTRFLNNTYTNELRTISEVVYNYRKGWLLNFGAIHGVSHDTIVHLEDPAITGKFYRAPVSEIFVDTTSLLRPEGLIIKQDLSVLNAIIEGLEVYELKLHITRHDGNAERLKIIADTLIENAVSHYTLTDDEQSADYSLHVRWGCIYITLPGDTFRPIVQPLELNEKDVAPAVKLLSGYLKHLSRWTHTKRLQNNEAEDPEAVILNTNIVQVFQDGSEETLAGNDRPTVVYAKVSPARISSLRIRLTNVSDQKLYVAVAYLSYNFGVYIRLLEPGVEMLSPGETVSLGKRATSDGRIALQLPDVVQEYNWPWYEETLKIIISEEEFNPEALSMHELPVAYTLKNPGTDRNMNVPDKVVPINFKGWITYTIHLNYPNIYYNKMEPSKINEMLKAEEMKPFAESLYKVGG